MEPEDLAARRHEVQVLDVRYPNEWEAGRIEGAMHITADELADRIDEIDSGRPVVTVCRSGSRSGVVARYLQSEGLDAENLEGGLLAWVDAGLPVTTPEGRPGAVVEPEESSDEGLVADPSFQAAFMDLVLEIQEHFGDHEPSEEEVQGYLRDRMIGEGMSPEEADQVLARISAKRGNSAD